jgi:hypothetical protein
MIHIQKDAIYKDGKPTIYKDGKPAIYKGDYVILEVPSPSTFLSHLTLLNYKFTYN